MKKVFAFALLFLPLYSPAQKQGQPLIDSIKYELLSDRYIKKEDSNKVNLLFDIAYTYYSIEPDSGLVYGDRGLKLAQRIHWASGIGQAYYLIGIINQVKARYHESLDNFFKALKIFEGKVGVSDKKYLGRTYEGIGSVYMQTDYLPKALEYQLSALKIRESINDPEGLAGNLSNIGNIYSLQNDYPKALEYYMQAQKIFKKLGKKEGIANCLMNIGYVYQQQGNFNKATENYFNALVIYDALKNKTGIASTMGNIGETYLAMASDTIRLQHGQNILLTNKNELLSKAILYLNRAITISKEVNQLDNIIEFSKYLSAAYEQSSNYRDALNNYKQYATVKDTVFSSINKIKINNLETEFNIESQKSQIALNKAALEQKQTEQKLYITGISFLLAILAFIFRRNIRQLRFIKVLSTEKKQAMERIEEQSNVLTHISHTQAHDVRGPITTILGLVSIFNHDDPADPDNKKILSDIAEVTHRLDKTVQEIVKEENRLSADKK